MGAKGEGEISSCWAFPNLLFLKKFLETSFKFTMSYFCDQLFLF